MAGLSGSGTAASLGDGPAELEDSSVSEQLAEGAMSCVAACVSHFVVWLRRPATGGAGERATAGAAGLRAPALDEQGGAVRACAQGPHSSTVWGQPENLMRFFLPRLKSKTLSQNKQNPKANRYI